MKYFNLYYDIIDKLKMHVIYLNCNKFKEKIKIAKSVLG